MNAKDRGSNAAQSSTHSNCVSSRSAVGLLHGLLVDPEMRIAAAHGLGSMGAVNAKLWTKNTCLKDPDEDVQNAVTYALGQW